MEIRLFIKFSIRWSMDLVTTVLGHVRVVVSRIASEYPSQSARFVARRHAKVEKKAYSVAFGTLQ